MLLSPPRQPAAKLLLLIFRYLKDLHQTRRHEPFTCTRQKPSPTISVLPSNRWRNSPVYQHGRLSTMVIPPSQNGQRFVRTLASSSPTPMSSTRCCPGMRSG